MVGRKTLYTKLFQVFSSFYGSILSSPQVFTAKLSAVLNFEESSYNIYTQYEDKLTERIVLSGQNREAYTRNI